MGKELCFGKTYGLVINPCHKFSLDCITSPLLIMWLAYVSENGWGCIRFRRILWGETLVMLQNLQHMCKGVTLSQECDKLVWLIGAHGKFSVHSFYCALKMQNNLYPHRFLWKMKFPLMIKVFLWLVLRISILTKDNLIKSGWHGAEQCQFCGREETVDHLFLSCPLSRYALYILACTFSFQSTPENVQHLLWMGWAISQV